MLFWLGSCKCRRDDVVVVMVVVVAAVVVATGLCGCRRSAWMGEWNGKLLVAGTYGGTEQVRNFWGNQWWSLSIGRCVPAAQGYAAVQKAAILVRVLLPLDYPVAHVGNRQMLHWSTNQQASSHMQATRYGRRATLAIPLLASRRIPMYCSMHLKHIPHMATL